MFSPLKRFYKFVLKRVIGNFLQDELVNPDRLCRFVSTATLFVLIAPCMNF